MNQSILIVSAIISFLLCTSVYSFRLQLLPQVRINSYNLRNKFNLCSLKMQTISEEEKTAYSMIKTQTISSITGKIPDEYVSMINGFMEEYADSNMEASYPSKIFGYNMMTFLKSIQTNLKDPYKFKPYHQAIREPFDYYDWGNKFIRPLVISDQSKLFGLEQVNDIVECMKRRENVVLLSNHQTEVDPQVISILLEDAGLSELAEKIIFIAGHKVTNDPVAVPFSMGRNLICIHSKKHIKNPPEETSKKMQQNLESMKELNSLMTQGGNIFWVAPSGGRDRPDPTTGEFVVTPFDIKAMDMFKLVAMQSQKTTQFFPMAMYTHKLVPPPDSVSSGIGESRSGKRGAVSINFLEKTNGLGGLKDKEFAAEIQDRVDKAYSDLVNFHKNFK